LVALVYFYKNQLYKRNDTFYKGILGAILIDIFGQIIMSYSATSFDTAHNVAHVLKDAGYFVNIIGLALSSIQYNAELKESNRKLREKEQLIREQYEKLKESDKMKTEFINVAAHELRTPIQPILGLIEIIHSKTKDPQQQELLEVTIRNAKRLQQLTENILDVTKFESKYIITNSIDDVITNIAYKNKRNLKLLYQPTDIFIRGDKTRITQVISNLLNNAVKFTDKGTITITITSTTEKKDNQVIVSINDTGVGIDPEVIPKLFSKFTSKSFQGTGLGLYICKSIIESHGGTIWAENNSDGKGATFTFSLPISK
jgi:signal transduction histidine kinase